MDFGIITEISPRLVDWYDVACVVGFICGLVIFLPYSIRVYVRKRLHAGVIKQRTPAFHPCQG